MAPLSGSVYSEHWAKAVPSIRLLVLRVKTGPLRDTPGPVQLVFELPSPPLAVIEGDLRNSLIQIIRA